MVCVHGYPSQRASTTGNCARPFGMFCSASLILVSVSTVWDDRILLFGLFCLCAKTACLLITRT